MYYHDDRLSEVEARAYLERIGCLRAPERTLDFLNELILLHQTSVPFENLDVFECGRAPALDLPSLYRKVVVNHRGGICFELNALFTALLKTLGYQARQVVARVVKDQEGAAWPVMHEGVIVTLNEDALYCDVGFGGPMPCGALTLTDGYTALIGDQTFQVGRTEEDWWAISRRTRRVTDLYDRGGEPKLQLELLLSTLLLDASDFIPLSFYYCVNPDSRFRQHRIVNLKTPNGHKSVFDNVFTHYENGAVQSTSFDAREALFALFEDEFHLTFNPPAAADVPPVRR